jgi:tetratricopeptide (TPR) repeat protein
MLRGDEGGAPSTTPAEPQASRPAATRCAGVVAAIVDIRLVGIESSGPLQRLPSFGELIRLEKRQSLVVIPRPVRRPHRDHARPQRVRIRPGAVLRGAHQRRREEQQRQRDKHRIEPRSARDTDPGGGAPGLEENQRNEQRPPGRRHIQIVVEDQVLFSLGRADDGLGDMAAAISDYRRALDLNPRQLESLNNLGVLYIRSGDSAQAERSLRRALEIDAGSVGTRSNLAVCYLQQRKYADAARELEQLVRATPSEALVYSQLGIAYEGMGRHVDAERALARARQLSPLPE